VIKVEGVEEVEEYFLNHLNPFNLFNFLSRLWFLPPKTSRKCGAFLLD